MRKSQTGQGKHTWSSNISYPVVSTELFELAVQLLDTINNICEDEATAHVSKCMEYCSAEDGNARIWKECFTLLSIFSQNGYHY